LEKLNGEKSKKFAPKKMFCLFPRSLAYREQIAELQSQVEERDEKIERWSADFDKLKNATEAAAAEMKAVKNEVEFFCVLANCFHDRRASKSDVGTHAVANEIESAGSRAFSSIQTANDG
jgi:lipid II:glycine glycyltransferase (peptidoglycan interpeptide bridge formation enzyme)